VPLPEPLLEVGSRVVAFFEEGGEPPYLVYQYLPRDEYAVRRELGDLRLWLGSRAVRCQAVSLADLFWQALEGSGWLASLIDQELAYVPTNASWMNRIEAQFTALRYFALDGTDHASHAEQASMIRRYIAWRNRNARDRRLSEIVNRANVA
jgi:hypothetical protein